ncbi:hypothetical protein RHODO2019_01750 [Rhodococcus antarcticus]|uniref:Uncharacterized protein n=1 Tax=Rhodococcus antarcticus TaxID=2987751 RepID=A0ABY6P143_9NOCA|nr:hypothetical protein [Rhodococcus antarcticus]UZJ25248.1 hypothetical protein RHODO2019_01750 [Rhodococcus antarcticus]
MTTPRGSDDQGWGQQPLGGQPDQGWGQQPHGGQPDQGWARQPHGYGGMAPMPGGTPPPVVRPSEVSTAFWLWVANMVVSLAGSVVAFATIGDTVRAQLADQVRADPSLNQADVETIIRVGVVVGVVFALLFVALQLFFVFRMRSGRSWARIVLTVLGGLSVLLTVAGLGSASIVDAGFGLVGAILIVAAIIYMFTGGARDYFAPRPKY